MTVAARKIYKKVEVLNLQFIAFIRGFIIVGNDIYESRYRC